MGVLEGGLPRPARAAISVAGVRTNFVSPDLLSIGEAPAVYYAPGGGEMWVLCCQMLLSVVVPCTLPLSWHFRQVGRGDDLCLPRVLCVV